MSDKSSDSSKMDSEELLVRRVMYYKNPFDVLEVTEETSEDEIQKKYKKLSLSLHPDKCKHPKAQDAFTCLNKAHKILQDAAEKKRYAVIMGHSRKQLTEEFEKQSKKPEGAQFEYDIKMRTQKLVFELDSANKKADEMRRANERREKDAEQKVQNEAKKRDEEEAEWEEKRTERVDSWRKFSTIGQKRKGGPGTLKPPKTKLVTK